MFGSPEFFSTYLDFFWIPYRPFHAFNSFYTPILHHFHFNFTPISIRAYILASFSRHFQCIFTTFVLQFHAIPTPISIHANIHSNFNSRQFHANIHSNFTPFPLHFHSIFIYFHSISTSYPLNFHFISSQFVHF